MNDISITIAIAKLDGWKCYTSSVGIFCPFKDQPANIKYWAKCEWPVEGFGSNFLPHYLTSHDAIIPVIIKLTEKDYGLFDALQKAFFDDNGGTRSIFFATPRQLCIALLKATGNYKQAITQSAAAIGREGE